MVTLIKFNTIFSFHFLQTSASKKNELPKHTTQPLYARPYHTTPVAVSPQDGEMKVKENQ